MSAAFDPGALRGKRTLVYSMGIEGRDLARFLVRHGAVVTMSDTRNEAALEAAGVTAPEGVTRTVTGGPLLDPEGFDLVAVSQSVLRHDPAMRRARELSIPTTSQMRLFLQLCPGKMIGITGSSGKSTTTALVGAMAASAGVEHVVGGNIGEALLGRLDDIRPETLVILEISHTQLQYTDRSPWIAAVTNVTPNHLDQFSWDEYVGLKRNILSFQGSDGVAVLNQDDHTSRGLMTSVRGRLVRTSVCGDPEGDAAWFAGKSVTSRKGMQERTVIQRKEIRLRGEHNLANVVMATAIGREAGFSTESMAAAIREFRGVPHRLEVVGVSGGATWVNDSIATSPERTIAGLRAFDEPVVLLLGGRDKNLPLDGLQELAGKRCRAVVCFGEARELFAGAMRDVVGDVRVVESLPEAVEEARGLVHPGDVVLLSPAGTSFDAFPTFEVRGQQFRQLVRSMPDFSVEGQ
ncbi:MAG: UDP-N-acetylmuramoyl-L-alanine--D-glutamate ligase [Dehalococcoidia bacterium]|nr:UDP-N-acetylmuramoyl-L-alanine--D-glutamate ligase [Dehalococcoidia bacterium]